MVTSQATKPIRFGLEEAGMRNGRHLILKKRAKPYSHSGVFVDSIQTVFLPHLALLRSNGELSDEEAVVLMDNCSPDLAPAAVGLLTRTRVRIVTFAPHTAHIFQALDLSLCGGLKRRGQSRLRFGDEKGTVQFIKKVYRDF
jgi:hypothetical protein